MKNLNNQSGRSMIEMLGVLAIIGVLSVGGIAGYSKAMLKYKTNKTIDQITMLVTNIRTLYAQQNTFEELNVTNAIKMGVVPDEMKNGDSALTNPFSGTVTIDVADSVPNAAGLNRAFVIGVNGIPKEACMAVAVSDWGSNYSSGLIAMAISNKGGETGAVKASSLLTGETTAYAGADCSLTAVAESVIGETTATQNSGAYCAKDLPIDVAEAAAGCNCDGSNCTFAIKYY